MKRLLTAATVLALALPVLASDNPLSLYYRGNPPDPLQGASIRAPSMTQDDGSRATSVPRDRLSTPRGDDPDPYHHSGRYSVPQRYQNNAFGRGYAESWSEFPRSGGSGIRRGPFGYYGGSHRNGRVHAPGRSPGASAFPYGR